MNRRFLFISLRVHLANGMLLISLAYCLVAYFPQKSRIKQIPIPTINHFKHHVYYTANEKYELILPDNGKMHIHYSGHLQNEIVSYEKDWEIQLNEDLPEMRIFDPGAGFFLRINSDFPYNKVERLFELLKKHGIYRIYLVGVKG